ncbi:Gfo/Idh/MocA family oxidoreductase [Phycicoccus sp. CSK15P-2]|uniref:Gfo/Idh/MocA family oxidoreductase n=1 Tax=Phycicoccus sp. CSK15P-2 TaxID=2807627 RepID=UPI00194E6566|nr:Gfo/Idh/MocA family oxidoreductase [Phycicoccus sp. CSK15P-2]MBM6406020.1 Gfo/Idh/MocA family oxidoreductase [Phycicoccus sp. CSK15P-2]
MGNELRIGIIGVGLMGADHAERVVERVSGGRLVAVSDPDTARATALAERYEGVRALADPLDLVADDDVDAVVIASPGVVHEEQVLACLAAGKHALCEKPLTMDGESSLRLVRAEREVGRPLVQLGFMRRFDPEYARMKELLGSGRLGRLLLVHNTHRNKDVPDSFSSEMIVRDSLVHEVDVARFLFDEEIAEVTVHSPTPTSAAAPGVVDPQVSVFRMAGGAVVTNEVFVRNQVGYEVRCEAVCERGTAIAGRPWGDLYTTQARDVGGSWGGGVPADFRQRFALAYDLEVQAWVDATRRGEVVGPTTWDGYAATVVSEAGMASLASGEPVGVRLADRETLS